LTLQALAERGEPALQHGTDRVGRAAADPLAHALDRRAQAVLQQRVGGFPDLRLLDAAATANRLSPAETNPMIDAIGAMMAAQISDTVGQDLEAGCLNFRLASRAGCRSSRGLLDGAKHRRKLADLTTIDSRANMDT